MSGHQHGGNKRPLWQSQRVDPAKGPRAGSAAWAGRVLFNEIIVALHPPFTAALSVMQHWGPPRAACAQKRGQLSFLHLLASERDPCQRGKAHGQAWHRSRRRKGGRNRQREKAPVTASLASRSLPPRSRRRTFDYYIWWKKLPLLEEERHILGEKKSSCWFKGMFPPTLMVAASVKRRNALGYSLVSQSRPWGVHSQVCTGRDGEEGSEAASEVQAWNTKLLQSGEIPHQHLLLIPTMKAFDSWCTQRAAQPPTSPRSQTMDVLTARKNLSWTPRTPNPSPQNLRPRWPKPSSFVRPHLRSPMLYLGLNHFSVNSS